MRKLDFRILPPTSLDRSPQEILSEKERKQRVESSLQSVNQLVLNNQPNDALIFPKNGYKKVEKATKRIIGGIGDVFGPVIAGLKAVERSSEESNLQLLENAANTYLADYNRRVEEGEKSKKPFKVDKITANKVSACKDALEKVRQLRAKRQMRDEFSKLANPPKNMKDELALNRLRGKLIVESGGGKPISGDEGKGASESYFLTDPITEQKAFVFKPGDGEFVPGLGWESGGGAPREVMVSVVNEELRSQIGLDCGVAPTTLVSLDHPSMGSNKTTGSSKRVGALQSFVKKDPDPTKNVVDKNFFNSLDSMEVEKIAILDFVTLQMDRQPDNLLVTSNSEGTATLTPIDGGSTFPGRKAFEAFRRQFSANALFSGEEGGKKFSPDALEKIEALDEERIAGRMRSAKEEMSEIDPNSASKIRLESIEITRRSILFLKAASKELTKVQIASAYANFFQLVIDAAPEDVNKIIQKAIQLELERPALKNQLLEFPDAKNTFSSLGWPPNQFNVLMEENPRQLLKILEQNLECEGTVVGISKLLSYLESNQIPIEMDVHTIPSLWEKYTKLKSIEEQWHRSNELSNPELLEAFNKLGWKFELSNGKEMNEKQKHEHLKQAIAYHNAGGDEFLKQKGLDPKTTSPEDKYYQSLGGDGAYLKLAESGFDVDARRKTSLKVSDLAAFQKYQELGGNEMFVQLGGIASKPLVGRVPFLQENSVLANEEGPTGMLQSLENMLELIMLTKDRCAVAEIELGKKRGQYAQLDRESLLPMLETDRQVRLQQLVEEDLYVSSILKKFGPWNAKIISPWKELQTAIKKQSRLASDERIKDLNREVSRGYDAYVEVFAAAQDLGQDYMDLLKRVKTRLEGTFGSQDETILAIRKLLETMTSELGAGSMIRKQGIELEKIETHVEKASLLEPPYTQELWDTSRDLESKVRQAFEVVKANYRAVKRLQANLEDLVRPFPEDRTIQLESQSVVLAIEEATLRYGQLELLNSELLKSIEELQATMQKRGVDALLVALGEMKETLKSSETKCEELKNEFEVKRANYEQYEDELQTELDQETRELRRKELVTEMNTLRKEEKKFGGWNADIITPWKSLQSQILFSKSENNKEIAKSNREVTQAYDSYVLKLGDGQELARDCLEYLSSLYERFGGKTLSVEKSMEGLNALEIVLASELGPHKMIQKQQSEIKIVETFIGRSEGKTEEFLPRQWQYLFTCETKIRQAWEIAKSNKRACDRGRVKLAQLSQAYMENRSVSEVHERCTKLLDKADELYTTLELGIPDLLRRVDELEQLRPVD